MNYISLTDKNILSQLEKGTNNADVDKLLHIISLYQNRFNNKTDRSIGRAVDYLQFMLKSPEAILWIVGDLNIANIRKRYLLDIAKNGTLDALKAIGSYIKDIDKELYNRIERFIKSENLIDGLGIASTCGEIDLKKNIEMLNSVVTNQEDVVNELAISIYEYLNVDDSEMANVTFITGPSGCGKTYIAQKACEIFHLPMLLIPIAAITEEGVKGENMSDVVKKISVFARRNKKGIIILDEFDKVLQKNFDGEGENRSERVQAQLMQIFWSYVKI